MTCATISADEAKRRIDGGAVLVDVREADEFAREHVPGAVNCPVSKLDAFRAPAGPVVFHCRSGARTAAQAGRLAAAAHGEAFILDGGLDAWKRAGLPVARDRRQPIELMRQVQIAAGSLVLAGVILGALVHPGFYGLAGFVGAGLVFAGVTGTCAMANLLRLAPWNRMPRCRAAA
jgi:rhodanese-related sulfurtransferase